MTLNIRRVITDHDAEGRAIVAIDERCANVMSRRPGHHSCVAWTGDDGTIFRIVIRRIKPVIGVFRNGKRMVGSK